MQSSQKIFYYLGAAIMIVFALQQGAFILVPICYAIIIAIVIDPMVTFLQQRIRFHILAFILAIVFILTVTIIPISLVIEQLRFMFSELNTEALDVSTVTSSIQQTLVETRLSRWVDLDLIKSQLDKILGPLGSLITTFLSSSGTMLLNLSLATIFSYFLSAYYGDVRQIIIKDLEKADRNKWRKIAKKAPAIIRSYLSGMLIVMVILAILNGLSLYLIGVKYAFTWGVIIGALAIIPYAGTFIGLLLPLTYSFISSTDYRQPLAIFICYLVIQQIEGNLLTPKIVGDKLKVNPFIIIIMILVFGKIWGLDGVIICLPLVGVAKSIMEEYEGSQIIAKLISSK